MLSLLLNAVNFWQPNFSGSFVTLHRYCTAAAAAAAVVALHWLAAGDCCAVHDRTR